MTSPQTPHRDRRAHLEQVHGSVHSYVFGFLFSLLCTALAFGLVQWDIVTQQEVLPHGLLVLIVIVLAVTQLVAQLIFFLHLDKGAESSWNLTILGFASIIICTVVGGSLWIMSNLKHTGMDDMYIRGIVTPANQEN